MSVCFDLVEFSILDVLGAPGFFEALFTLAWVLECGVTSFPRFIADVRWEKLFSVCTHFGGLAANVHRFPVVHRRDGVNRHVSKNL